MNTTEGIYTTGDFAKKANVSLRTIRYYDKQGLLKPSYLSDAGYRLYTDEDFARLQMIMSLKYLGFGLDEIKTLSVKADDAGFISESLKLQSGLIKKKMEELSVMYKAVEDTRTLLKEGRGEVDWQQITGLIHSLNMEKSLAEQYQNGENLSIRIKLHKEYSTNPEKWFPWVFSQMGLKKGMKVLEIGCGNGTFWEENKKRLPEELSVVLTDISTGMIAEAKEKLEGLSGLDFVRCDCCELPFEAESFDVVYAGHVLFYAKDRKKAVREAWRVLKPGGVLVASTYGKHHMREVSKLAKEFDSRIALSDVELFERFGLENGDGILGTYFARVEKRMYADELRVRAARPLAEYIMSCHGNQREVLYGHEEEFNRFLSGKLEKKGYIRITKEAGVFLGQK